MIGDISPLLQHRAFKLSIEEVIENHGHNHHYSQHNDSIKTSHLVLVMVILSPGQVEHLLAYSDLNN